MITVTYTLSAIEEKVILILTEIHNRNTSVNERLTPDKLIIKFIQGHLKIHNDKVATKEARIIAEKYLKLKEGSRAIVDAELNKVDSGSIRVG